MNLLEDRTKQLDNTMKKCRHPPKNRIELSAGKNNEVCGLCGKVNP